MTHSLFHVYVTLFMGKLIYRFIDRTSSTVVNHAQRMLVTQTSYRAHIYVQINLFQQQMNLTIVPFRFLWNSDTEVKPTPRSTYL